MMEADAGAMFRDFVSMGQAGNSTLLANKVNAKSPPVGKWFRSILVNSVSLVLGSHGSFHSGAIDRDRSGHETKLEIFGLHIFRPP